MGHISNPMRQEHYLHSLDILNLDTMYKGRQRLEINTIKYILYHALWASDKNTRKHIAHESQEASPFPAGDHGAARTRQDSITKTNMNHK